jgi:hypothetical protein
MMWPSIEVGSMVVEQWKKHAFKKLKVWLAEKRQPNSASVWSASGRASAQLGEVSIVKSEAVAQSNKKHLPAKIALTFLGMG